MAKVTAFLEADRRKDGQVLPNAQSLSPRELDILRLAADSLTNDAIAASLGLSARTIERHLSNAYAKLGTSGKSARAAAVAHVVRGGLG
jgi:DNA-binding CsgD family transcriptional regulator